MSSSCGARLLPRILVWVHTVVWPALLILLWAAFVIEPGLYSLHIKADLSGPVQLWSFFVLSVYLICFSCDVYTVVQETSGNDNVSLATISGLQRAAQLLLKRLWPLLEGTILAQYCNGFILHVIFTMLLLQPLVGSFSSVMSMFLE